MIDEIGRLRKIINNLRIQGISIYDDFNDNTKDTDIWDTDTTAGSTTISETATVTRFANPGTGTLGYSYRPTIETFGKSLVIESDIVLTTGALGTSYEAYIELYIDASNYFQFGFWKDAGADSRGRITYNIAGAGEASTDVDTTDTDAVSRNYRIIVDEHSIHVYLERQLLSTIEFEQLNNYIVRMVAGTGGNADVMEVNFNNFHIFSYWEHDIESYRRIESVQGGSESIQSLWNQLDNLLDLGRSGDSASNLHLDMTEQTLWEVTAQTTPFQHTQSNIDLYNMGLNDTVLIRKYQIVKSGGTYRLCTPVLTYNNLQSTPLKEIGLFTNQYSAKLTIEQTQNNGIEGAATFAAGPVWVNETVPANNVAAGDMNLLPVGGDAVNDAYYFGGDRPFGNIIITTSQAGVRATSDWTILYEYWDGALWSDVSNISDGTTMFRHAPGTLNITFDVPTDWATTNEAGSLPFNIYWFRMRISVAGVGAFTQPLATQAWIYLTIDHSTFDALR